MRTRVSSVWALFAALVSGACDDPLKPLERVEDLRVLGARTEVDGEPRRAAPLPGESARVRWLVAAPALGPELGWSLAACVAAPGKIGIPECDGEAFASTTSAAPSAAEPELSFSVPAGLDPDSNSVAVLGSICAGSLPEGTAQSSACPEGVEGTRVSFEFVLSGSRDVNFNPSFDEPALLLDGMPWAAALAMDDPCDQGAYPMVRAASRDHELSIVTAADARDPLTPDNELDPERESLLISHFSTDGSLERAFSNLTASDSARAVSVRWHAPKEARAGGQLVRFWFVLRDGRGGSDFAERAVCVIP